MYFIFQPFARSCGAHHFQRQRFSSTVVFPISLSGYLLFFQLSLLSFYRLSLLKSFRLHILIFIRQKTKWKWNDRRSMKLRSGNSMPHSLFAFEGNIYEFLSKPFQLIKRYNNMWHCICLSFSIFHLMWFIYTCKTPSFHCTLYSIFGIQVFRCSVFGFANCMFQYQFVCKTNEYILCSFSHHLTFIRHNFRDSN